MRFAASRIRRVIGTVCLAAVLAFSGRCSIETPQDLKDSLANIEKEVGNFSKSSSCDTEERKSKMVCAKIQDLIDLIKPPQEEKSEPQPSRTPEPRKERKNGEIPVWCADAHSYYLEKEVAMGVPEGETAIPPVQTVSEIGVMCDGKYYQLFQVHSFSVPLSPAMEGFTMELFGKSGLSMETISPSVIVLAHPLKSDFGLEIAQKEVIVSEINGIECKLEIVYLGSEIEKSPVKHKISINFYSPTGVGSYELGVQEGATVMWGLTPTVGVEISAAFAKEDGAVNQERIEVQLRGTEKWTVLMDHGKVCNHSEGGICTGSTYDVIFSRDEKGSLWGLEFEKGEPFQ